MYSIIISVLITLIYLIIITKEFNLSPKPNFIFKEPNLRTYMPKIRSSYFGFTIVLRENSLLVGAPRAQSTLESQRKVNETGAIYKCLLKTRQCAPYVFDSLGNIIVETIKSNDYTYDSEKKDYQWLGMTMDGGPKESDRLVVCAPRLIADLPNHYLMHGICYWTEDTISDKSMKIRKISPLRLRAEQVKEINDTKYFYYMFGEQGISVHITENNEEILIGAPGVFNWKGTIIRYSAKVKDDVGGLSRRESDNINRSQSINYLSRQDSMIEYVSEVLNPSTWNQPDDSYFGYSVTSGFFEIQSNRKQILYVASAPQANKLQGEVYLFDIVKTFQDLTIKKYYTFRGNQFGEYFGYALLAEDLNNDGMTDIIVSAPFYSVENSYEKGAIYVFINKGKADFENPKIITTKTDTPDRFGTSITKLGDINHDGYNDIAVGAPFEGDGAVYIFLGSSTGLKDKASQVLKYPKVNSDKLSHNMFGYGLSKGVDVDGNSFNDFAIGAPNAEVVYLYKSYPVVTIVGTIKASSREIKIYQTDIQLTACYHLESSTQTIIQQDIIVRLKIDILHKRVLFTNTKSNEMIFEATAKDFSECRLINATVKFNSATVFKPIEVEMHYKLKNEIPNNGNTTEIEDFCETCAMIDPSNPTTSLETISFSTGCEDECVADLKIKSSGLNSHFVVGSNDVISVTYEITNKGEYAFLPQINITSLNRMPFVRIPPNCEQNDFIMICNLHKILPMAAGDIDFITIIFDTSNIEGDSIMIQAEVSSTGKEAKPDDNFAFDTIELIEVSDVEIQAYPNPPRINLEDSLGVIGITNTYEIRNYGPSKIKEMNISILIPTSYNLFNFKKLISIVDINSLTVNAIYHQKTLSTDYYQNDIILLPNPIEKSSTLVSLVENLKNPKEYQWNNEVKQKDSREKEIDESDSLKTTRKKRDIKIESTANDVENETSSSSKENLSNLIGSLPITKTILFHCDKSNKSINCIEAVTNVFDFEANDNRILNITIKYDLNLTEINKILIEPMEFFVITNDIEVTKVNTRKSDSFKIRKTIVHNIIAKHRIYSTSLWVYIIPALGGILVLTIIIYGLRRYGFFIRHKKEELRKLIRESKIQQNDETDESPLQK